MAARTVGGVSARTVKHAHQLLDQAMDEAVKHGLVLRNVFAIQRPPKVEAKEMRILNGEQIAGFPALVDGDELAAPAITSLFAGTRRGEDLALRWGRLELDAKVLMVRESLEKTKKEGVQFRPPKTKASKRDISLPDIVVETLRAHRKRTLERRLLLGLGKLSDDDLVFPDWTGPSPGTLPQDPNAFSAAWSRLAAKFGLKVSFHELRHTHASQLIDEGVDIVKIAKRLGHGSPAITLSTYAHLFERKRKKEEQDPAADAINKALSRKE
jgi:integrase